MNVTVSVNDKALIDALIGLGKETERALTSALNTSARKVRTEAVKIIQQELNVKTGSATKAIKVQRAYRGSSVASLQISGWPIPMIGYLGTTQGKKGVSVKVKRFGKRTILKHAFIATMRSGHKGVFWREKSATSRSGLVGRLKIQELFSLALQQALPTIKIDRLIDLARKSIAMELAREIKFRMGRRSSKL